jgi:hypothetical protein
MKKIIFFSVSLLLLSIFACVKNEVLTPAPINFGYEYFPLKVGKYKVFQVDSILFDTIAGKVKVDSFRLFQREVVLDTFVNQGGETIYRVERFEKRNLKDAWVIKDVLSIQRNGNQATRTDQGLRLVKMVFPLKKRQDWNSLLFIDAGMEITVAGEPVEIFKNWESETLDLDKAESINGKKFGKVLTISHANDENKLELRKVTEKYVKDTGLVMNEMLILDTQSTLNNENWRKKAQRGFIYRQILIENN